MRPGTLVQERASTTPATPPTGVSRLFLVGTTTQGPVVPTLVRSLGEFVDRFGARLNTSYMYDTAESYFLEGGSELWISRVVSGTAVTATRVANDSGAAPSLAISANSPGSWGNNISYQIIAGSVGGTYQLKIFYPNSTTPVEQSGDLVTSADAAAWSKRSRFVVVAATGANPPATGSVTALTTGNDNIGGLADADYTTALNKFTTDLGAGQVAAPGNQSATVQAALLTHAAVKNRYALIAGPDTATQATIVAAASTLAGSNAVRGLMAVPWIIMPGLVQNTSRVVPPEGYMAGRFARVDLTDGPNVPAAGDKGISVAAVGLSQPPWDENTRDALNTAGVTVIRQRYGNVQIYGIRSLAAAPNQFQYAFWNNNRLMMAIQQDGQRILDSELFAQIDGQGYTLSGLSGALQGMMLRYYNSGQVYGATPQEAFLVDVGPSVNTDESIANHELHAVVSLRPSPAAEFVQLDLVRVPITQGV